MKLAKCLAILLALAVSVGSAQLLLAQGTDLGTIRGTVTDPSGAVVRECKCDHRGSGHGYVTRNETNRTRRIPDVRTSGRAAIRFQSPHREWASNSPALC